MSKLSVSRTGKGSSQRQPVAQTVTTAPKSNLQSAPVYKTAANPIGRRYAERIGPQRQAVAKAAPLPPATGEATVGNRLNKVASGLKQGAKTFKTAIAAAPKQQVASNVVREKLSPTPASTTTMRMAPNRVTGNTTGFTSGTQTGKTVTKGGTAYKTAITPSQRMAQNAADRKGMSPSRSSGGGGGTFRSSAPGGRGRTGPAGMGSGRGRNG